MSYTLSLCLATGSPFLGRSVSRCRVLYFDEENSRRDRNAYLNRLWRGLNKPPLLLLKANFFPCLKQLTKNYVNEMADTARVVEPALIVVDTANTACHVKDENDNAEATAIIKGLGTVRQAAGADAVMIVLKHAKYHRDDSKYEIRGASAWKGIADGTIIHKIAAHITRPFGTKYRHTVLWPDKTRAFGLPHPIGIKPISIDEDTLAFEPFTVTEKHDS